jgi:hypothetical protein
MRYADLITLYFERSNAIQNYWTLYVVVIGGLLAVASLRRERDLIAGVLATALFCGFAYKNLDAIHDVTLNRFATLAAIKQFDPSNVPLPEQNEIRLAREQIEPTLLPPGFDGVRNFHIGCTLVTVATLWGLQWRRTARTPVK